MSKNKKKQEHIFVCKKHGKFIDVMPVFFYEGKYYCLKCVHERWVEDLDEIEIHDYIKDTV